jgi:hydroxymethylbilane synthase
MGGGRALHQELDVALLADGRHLRSPMKDVRLGFRTPFCRARFFEQTNDAFIYKDGSVTRRRLLSDNSVGRPLLSAVNPSSAAKNPTKCVNFRGNVPDPSAQARRGVVDATLAAGLKRMGMEGCATSILEWDDAAGFAARGAIGIRSADPTTNALSAPGGRNHTWIQVVHRLRAFVLKRMKLQNPNAGRAYRGRKILFRLDCHARRFRKV